MTQLKILLSLVGRNVKCYFKNKMTFFASLITPLIMFVLYVTFLRNVYVSSFDQISKSIDTSFEKGVIDGAVGAWLMSSILSVCSVTIAFCSNIITVEDKMNAVINDFNVTPVKKTIIAWAYFISNYFVTLIVILAIMIVGHIYLAIVGWYISVVNTIMIIVDCLIGILFGTLLAIVCEYFISTQGGISAISSLVSSMYGFICGAYMPISQFSVGLRNILGFLPGTYGVGLLRNHYMNGYVDEMVKSIQDPTAASAVAKSIKDSFDANMYLFENKVSLGAMYAIIFGACVALAIAYVSMTILKNKKK